MDILGLTTMTESSAVLLRDGQVVAAVEQERFTRRKHDGGIPYESIQFVLDAGNTSLADIDAVSVYWDPYKLRHRFQYLLKLMVSHPSDFLRKMNRATTVWRGGHSEGQDAGWTGMFGIGSKLAKHFGVKPQRVEYVDHHLAHMASCYFASPFDEAAILIMDGAGEAACTTTGVGRGDTIKVLHEHLLPHSLGHFYSSITGFLGFRMLDGEYKLMGLSPYGDPSGANWIRQNYLVTPHPGTYRVRTEALDYHRALAGDFSGTFQHHFGDPRPQSDTAEFNDRHRHIAASAQSAFEDVVLDLAIDLRKKTGMRNLTIAGGCGLNCVANGRILREGVFEQIYVPPVPHDAGGSLGAAMSLYHTLTGRRPDPVSHAQFGPEFDTGQIESAVASQAEICCEQLSEEALIARAADALQRGEVIAWMQGPMEFGPRALGNRSFLADPRSDSIRDAINAKIKKRELFRPFAPSVKAEKASEYFEIDQPSPFMTIIVPVREGARDRIPAVTHVDGTARPQTVDRDVNPRYWKLLDAFEERTGVAVLLNTSFNIQEPIVCSPQEALATFADSTTDALVMGDSWITHRRPKTDPGTGSHS